MDIARRRTLSSGDVAVEIVASESPLNASDAITPDLLMRGMAHDLNNMLAVLASGLSILERGKDDARRTAIIDGMNRAVINAATLAKDIVSLTGNHAQSPERLALASIIDGMAVLIDESLGRDIVLKINLAQDLWPIRAVRTYLEFALLNLVVNASDAMAAGGILTIQASNAARRRSDRSNMIGDFVRIEVIDTGEGIVAEIIPRVFEPFFTTKTPSKGTGLGLGQVRRFTDQHGGDVAIESSVGKGTRVILHLPRA